MDDAPDPDLPPVAPSPVAQFGTGEGAPPVTAAGRPLQSIGRGGTRECFAHPVDPARCVKLPLSRRGRLQSAREQDYLARVTRRYPDERLNHVARALGTLPTSRGPGHVFERVVDEASDGTLTASPTLLDALRHGVPADRRVLWRAALSRFRTWALSTPVVLRDLEADNVCVRRLADGSLRLVVIDGIGPRGVVPRLWPTRRYARERNRAMLERHGFDDLERLVSRRHARAIILPDAPTDAVTDTRAPHEATSKR